MKVGLIVQYYVFRNDARVLIEHLHQNENLVLFVEEKDNRFIPETYEKRIVKSNSKNLFNKIWNILYLLFGNIPKSKENYKNWRQRRIDLIASPKKRFTESLLLYMQLYFPTLITFDTYIRHLNYKPVKTDDIDVFLSFTDVSNPYIIAQIIQEKKSIYTYVYSWDHLAKFHRFSKTIIKYLTWNDHIKDDLITLHGVNPKHIKSIGSSQFTLIHDYLNKQKSSPAYDFPYIYFAASFGYSKIANQEVKIIEHLSDTLASLDPAIKLLFRPYPLLSNWDTYTSLRKKSNIIFDEYEQNKFFYDPLKAKENTSSAEKKYTFSEEDIDQKFNAIDHALAIVHCGSTMGLESSYFSAPVVYINYKNFEAGVDWNDKSHIRHSNTQRHLVKYLLLEEYENVVTDQNKLAEVLYKILHVPQTLMHYSKKLSDQTSLKNMDTFAKDCFQIIKDFENEKRSGHTHG